MMESIPLVVESWGHLSQYREKYWPNKTNTKKFLTDLCAMNITFISSNINIKSKAKDDKPDSKYERSSGMVPKSFWIKSLKLKNN